MSGLTYNIVKSPEGAATVSVFYEGRPYITTNENPRFDEIVRRVKENDVTVVDLFDYSRKVRREFQRLSERVTVRGGKVLIDGGEVNEAISNKIIAFIEEGVDDWKPLVAFLEKVEQNPSKHSRDQLYDFLMNNHFSITENGDIIGYKGMVEENGLFRSTHNGTTPVSVNDEEPKEGYVWQAPGDLVEMARDLVDDNSGAACSTGLHVSNFDYAKSYGTVMAVLFNPRDAVSVPNDSSFQKVRVCRYRNVGVVTEGHKGSLVREAEILGGLTEGDFAEITGSNYYDEWYYNTDDELVLGEPYADLQNYIDLHEVVMVVSTPNTESGGEPNYLVRDRHGEEYLVGPDSLRKVVAPAEW